MVSVAVLVTLIGRGLIDIKLKPKGLSNFRCVSTRNPVSLHPISYLPKIAARIVTRTILVVLLDSFLEPLLHKGLDGLR
jgi:hypothetical protein